MIDQRYAITAAVLIAITCFASVFGGVFIYLTQSEVILLVNLTRPEVMPPGRIVLSHLLMPSVGIATWLIMRKATRKFPNPHNLEASLKKYYGLMLVFVCGVGAFVQTILLGIELGIIEPSPIRAKLFIAAIGLFYVVLGNNAGKLPSPFKGLPEPFIWDKMARFEGRLTVITGLIFLLVVFALPSRMAPALVLWGIFTVVVVLLKHHQLKQEKKNEGL